MKKLWLACVLAVAVCTGAWATEGGGGAYPNGAEGFMTGALPPPGSYFLDYVMYYTADKMAGPNGDGVVPDFDLDVIANVFRFVYVTKAQVLGGSYAAHVFVPVVDLDVSVPGMSDSKTGLGDIIVDPFILGWHSKNLHCVSGIDVYIPSGNYEAMDLANVSRGYWTIEPVVAVTYLGDGGLDVSAKMMYDFNLENSDTDYTSGQEFHVDYSVAQKIGAFAAGVGGYYYKQTTDDKSDNVAVVENGKGQTLAVGPQVKYDYKNMSFMLKYQFEMETENRPEGDKAWFTFLYAF